ncbi:MAG: hypothetical protein WA941_18405 [Nitrososphaeraceae archaeon]
MVSSTKKEQAKIFLESINKELRSKFEELHMLKLNPNTKGGEYEKHVSNLLCDYLGSRFDFHVRAQITSTSEKLVKLSSYRQTTKQVYYRYNQIYNPTNF